MNLSYLVYRYEKNNTKAARLIKRFSNIIIFLNIEYWKFISVQSIMNEPHYVNCENDEEKMTHGSFVFDGY